MAELSPAQSKPLTRVVLIGATGTVGRHIVNALLTSPTHTYTITILTRPSSTTTALIPSSPNITIVSTELDSVSTLTPILRGHDAIIHAAAIPSFSTQRPLIDAAIAANVPRFILNEFANSPVTQAKRCLPELEPFRTLKRELMAYADQKSAETNGAFTWSGLATGNFLDYSLKKYPMFGIDVRNRKVRFVDDGTERFSAVVLADIGLAVRGMLERVEETRNRVVHIRSVETSQREIWEALKAEMGQEGWEVTSEDGAVMYERGKEAFAKGERGGHVDLLVVQLFQKGAGRSVVVTRDECDNELLGVREKEVGEVVREVLRTFDQV